MQTIQMQPSLSTDPPERKNIQDRSTGPDLTLTAEDLIPGSLLLLFLLQIFTLDIHNSGKNNL